RSLGLSLKTRWRIDPTAPRAALHVRRYDETVAEVRDGLDVPRSFGIVTKPAPQAADVACERVVPDHLVPASERITEVLVADDRSSDGSEGVEEDVLD